MNLDDALILNAIEKADRPWARLAESPSTAVADATAAVAQAFGSSDDPHFDLIVAATILAEAQSWRLLEWDEEGLPWLCGLQAHEIDALVRWTYSVLADKHVDAWNGLLRTRGRLPVKVGRTI